MRILFFVVFFCFGLSSFAQSDESLKVKATIAQLFKGMAAKDSFIIKSVMHSSARLQTVAIDKTGVPTLQEEIMINFVKQIAAIPADVMIEERILSYEIRVDGNLATAWTPYQFYVNGKLSHCGVDAFQLFKDVSNSWKIIQISDTRRKDNCN